MKKKMAAVMVLLLATFMTLYSVSGTYAKYTSTTTGAGTATVAKWDVSTTGFTTDGSTTTFNLFSTTGVYDLKGLQETDLSTVSTPSVDSDVVQSGAKVAPGTWGKVSFELSNKSDVSASYEINISALSTTLPLEFSTNGTTWTKASDITTSISTNPYSLGTSTLSIGSTTEQKATVTLYWRWAYEVADDASTADNDTSVRNTSDTSLGTTGTATCSITANVIFTQVD